MTGRGGRAASMAVAWVASVLVAAYLMAPSLAPAPEADLAGAPTVSGGEPAGDSARLPGLPGDAIEVPARASTARAEAAIPPLAAPTPSPPASAEAAPGDPTASQAMLRVRVTRPDGNPIADATVYALPAGAPGHDDADEMFHAYTGANGYAELEVPRGVLLDVGAVAAGGRAMQQDVRTEASGVELSLTLSLGRPVTVVCEAIPGLDPRWRGRLVVGLFDLGTSGSAQSWFPGRGERLSGGNHQVRIGEDGRGRSPPLVPGSRYRMDTRHLRSLLQVATKRTDQEFAATPRVVTAGDTVTLSRVTMAEISLRVEHDPAIETRTMWVNIEAIRPEGTLLARLASLNTLTLGGNAPAMPPLRIPPDASAEMAAKMRRRYQVMRARMQARRAALRFPLVRKISTGAVQIRWSGRGVEPGVSELLELRPGQRTEYTVHLRPGKATAADTADDSTMRLGLAGRALPEDADVYCFVHLPSSGGDEAESFNLDLDEPQVEIATVDLARASPAIAVANGLLATPPFEVRAGGAPTLTFRPGGLLVIVETGAVRAQVGALLELERVDGAPIPWSEQIEQLDFAGTRRGLDADWVPSEAYRRVPGRLGAVLGPFPAGVVRFRMHRGGFPVGELSVTVEAGRIRPLVVR